MLVSCDKKKYLVVMGIVLKRGKKKLGLIYKVFNSLMSHSYRNNLEVIYHMFFSDSDISGLHKHLYLFFMQKILLLVSHGETEYKEQK